ncbi:MAG: nucleoside transporter C-terminal domain-containing protein [Dokdonella sp.]|jgi:CNT family concentrative nucleoside transporter|uniref:NupC/NupG family nucleoside CNT transporter n=2 Tax=Dokdonella sp. TaxID=2291710 RepID=UPI0025BC5591|nr:nucleoside transporter C-terminal domain-containing protein [Dokdonella sp.]MCC6441477.1 NupC/NupG family nucleoside CNT transporter [Rhodanobacteraceae bacterium]MBK8123550.1 NupC/NupG family nucleoside CNT transporter [Dokdonella sp.]HNV07195.1 nucleoside transporter C-terminal domain-containing protein [Dokdonella sp.]HPW04285.1 nucleoside transporter C-terminal domain-containing protein [Dokdonella sp.]HQV49721.1 nucleoside transporter C-terminal domain-containing protein [Dokdonella sp
MIEALGHIGFGLFGLAVLVSIAVLFSENRRAISWKLVATGIVLQIVFAALVLKVPFGRDVFHAIASGFVSLLDFCRAGSEFIFGGFMDTSKFGFVFAVQVLPTIIFFAALTGVLYHLGVMQWIVKGMAWTITKVMNVSGAETTSVCASVFIGQTEAPLTIKPYIERMTQSELMTVMIGGMAHIAGSVMAAYVGLLGGSDQEQQVFFATHLLTASIMAAPATLMLAKILLPETGQPLTRGQVKLQVEKTTANVIDAAATGAADGLRLALNVGAMLLAFIALIALLNAPFQWLGTHAWGADPGSSLNAWMSAQLGHPVELSLQTLFGWILAPVAWVIGVPWQDATLVGSFIGQKVVINEFVAYVDMAKNLGQLSEHSQLISTYALCGFANFSSIAIQIGGIGGLAPSRRADLAKLGLKAVLGGSLATFMTATIAGVLNTL